MGENTQNAASSSCAPVTPKLCKTRASKTHTSNTKHGHWHFRFTPLLPPAKKVLTLNTYIHLAKHYHATKKCIPPELQLSEKQIHCPVCNKPITTHSGETFAYLVQSCASLGARWFPTNEAHPSNFSSSIDTNTVQGSPFTLIG